MYNFTKLTERFTQFCFWQLPIIYVQWPANRTWRFTKVQSEENYRNYDNARQFTPDSGDKLKSAKRMKSNATMNDSSSSDEEQHYSGATYGSAG